MVIDVLTNLARGNSIQKVADVICLSQFDLNPGKFSKWI